MDSTWRLAATLVLIVSYLCVAVNGTAVPPPLPDAIDRANLTIRGLFRYFWSGDPINKDAMFYFACGQIGGGGGNVWSKCGCATPATCITCYRWFDAVALETVAAYGVYTGSMEFADTPDNIFNHSPYNSRWNATTACTFMDDFTWYGMAYLRVYEWLKVSSSIVVGIHCETSPPA